MSFDCAFTGLAILSIVCFGCKYNIKIDIAINALI